jgi:5-methylphenazine-1-carboxylate 1-monooxygenase
VPARIHEAASEIRPLGVGINLQPNAVRELFDLGLGAEVLDRVGLPAKEWALVGLNGNDIHAEPRGLDAGYRWPQYAVHRGAFTWRFSPQAVRDRLGEGAVVTGARAQGYTQMQTA